eukprot:GHVN01096356.1.p2 GENE.GHVN01096356.1~~GHVN01096356.1.p2  ORF type:complete len:390 (-),score=50.21 GHVN01096356.1:829-1998(-)
MCPADETQKQLDQLDSAASREASTTASSPSQTPSPPKDDCFDSRSAPPARSRVHHPRRGSNGGEKGPRSTEAPSAPITTTRATAASASTASTHKAPTYTPKQREVVERIIAAKGEHYLVMGLKKDDSPTDDQIKRAYKSLAVCVHPDKNKHPHSERAFKSLSLAYQVLCDKKEREIYDHYGTTTPSERQTYGHAAYSAEELFAQMFGAAFHPGNRVRVTRRQPPFEGRQNNEMNGDVNPRLAMLIMVVAAAMLLSSFVGTPQRPLWEFTKSKEFPVLRHTKTHNVQYYVGHEFDSRYHDPEKVTAHTHYGPHRQDVRGVEEMVEKTHFRFQCEQENQKMLQKMNFIRLRRPKAEADAEIAELRKTGAPSCDVLRRLNGFWQHTHRGMTH